ncbi:MAG: hypothetical protein K6T73_01275 [Candidatus Bathyarchaeota archaeon]|nr:hypothetical protein [Candidatus Bathyarchaeota archaeon]
MAKTKAELKELVERLIKDEAETSDEYIRLSEEILKLFPCPTKEVIESLEDLVGIIGDERLHRIKLESLKCLLE